MKIELTLNKQHAGDYSSDLFTFDKGLFEKLQKERSRKVKFDIILVKDLLKKIEKGLTIEQLKEVLK